MQRYLIPGIFALSGAAGLIFEVVWARQLVLVFGNTSEAVSAILTGFFGGMAVGSWQGGKLADAVRRPLRLYGFLELLLVAVVLLTPVSFRLIAEIYRSVFSTLEEHTAALSVVRFALALLALAPATILMGATLPTLTRHLARAADGLSAAFSRLYLANIMGAVFGAAAAGMILIELLGLSRTLLVGATCSGIAGAIALALDSRAGEPSVDRSAEEKMSSAAETAVGQPPRIRLALLVAFVSGLTSLAYQVLWTRLIASGTGNSTYVFTLILTLFLTGLAAGAVEYKRSRLRITRVVEFLAAGQIGISVAATAGMYAIISFDPTYGSFVWKTIATVLPATFLMGLTLPAAATLLGERLAQAGTLSGRLLAANTLGAILATCVLPFLVIPLVGSPRALACVAVVNALTGIVLLFSGGVVWSASRRILVTVGFALILAIAGSVARQSLFIDPNVARLRTFGDTLYRTAEDKIASVQAGSTRGYKKLWVIGTSMSLLTVDAKLMSVLPLMLRPSSTTLLAIAFGMGSTYRSGIIAGLRTDVVELVPSVPLMFDTFYGDAESILRNERGRVLIADGRSHVELVDRRYDIIVVDPPPPVESSGVSVISSREFYAACKARLNRGGVMMQWVPFGQTLDEFKAHVRTFADVYPNVIVAIGPGRNGFYMLGSEAPIKFDENSIRMVLSRQGVLEDISSAFDSPSQSPDGWAELVPRLVRLSGRQVSDFVGPGPLVTDDRPLSEYFLLRHAYRPSPWLSSDTVQPPGP